MKCDCCQEEIKEIPFKCPRCGGIFCEEHRLYENHKCMPITRNWGTYIDLKNKGSSPLKSKNNTRKEVFPKEEKKVEARWNIRKKERSKLNILITNVYRKTLRVLHLSKKPLIPTWDLKK